MTLTLTLMQAGNWVDIVRHVKNVQWNYDQAKHGADFFTGRLDVLPRTSEYLIPLLDRECIDAYVVRTDHRALGRLTEQLLWASVLSSSCPIC